MELSEEEKKLVLEEEKLFEKTIRSLCEELPQAQAAKIAANQSARSLTSKVTNEWNPEERQPLVSDEAVAHRVVDIRKESDSVLKQLIEEPYFGRVVTAEDDGKEVAFLIGKKGNVHSGIVDWRNGPISALYFNYKQGEEFYEVINDRERSGRIKIRRSYKIENGRLVQIDTPEGVFHCNESGWIKLDVDAEIAAHRSRAAHSREKRLPSILSLITKDQFQMITSDPHRPVIIQGSAGSGKTTVALHRLAWLLHGENSQALPENTRVVVMNKALQMYVSATLPSMGIEGVETTTFNAWAFAIIRNAMRRPPNFKFFNLPEFVETIKFSEEILNALSARVDKQAGETDRLLREQFQNRETLRRLWIESAAKPPLPRLRDFMQDVKDATLPEPEKKKHLADLKARLDALEDHAGDIYDLLCDEHGLKAHLKPHPKRGEHLAYLKKVTEKNRKSHTLDYFDLSLLLKNIQLKNGGLPGKNGLPMVLDHLVIDEVQDFGPVEFSVMKHAVHDPRHLTIVGDVSQKILFTRKFIGWERIVHHLEMDASDLIQLQVSFRCTVPIMELAHRVAGTSQPVEGRPGPHPVWRRAEDRDAVLETLADWTGTLLKEDPNRLIALICRYPKQAMELKEDLEEMIPEGLRLGYRSQFSFEPGVLVTNIHQVKGLEFDAVAIVDPDEENYPHRKTESRNLLYVAITRAQDALLLTGQRPFSSLLKT